MPTTNEDGLTFSAWLDRANHDCAAISGLTLADLPDSCMWDAWNDGVSPRDHAVEVLAREGFPFPEPPPRPAALPANPLATEVERKANYLGGRFYNGKPRPGYSPATAAIDAAIAQRKATGKLPRLY